MFMDLMRGDIVSRDGELVVFGLDSKYCRSPGDKAAGIEERYHEGFCTLKIGEIVQDALRSPASDAVVKELLK
jgi:hypothetical protein